VHFERLRLLLERHEIQYIIPPSQVQRSRRTPSPSLLKYLTELVETEVRGVVAEAPSADHEVVLPDKTLTGSADAADGVHVRIIGKPSSPY